MAEALGGVIVLLLFLLVIFFANSIKIVTHRGVVYLMGRVTEREANRAVELARGVTGVRKVVKAFELISEDELAHGQASAAPASAPAR